MHRFIVVVAVLLLVAGCGGGDGDNGGSASRSDQGASAGSTPGRQAIPEAPAPDVTAGVNILPYLDADGTVTEGTISPGQEFSIHVIAEVEGSSHVSAAQFAMAIPEGITVTEEEKPTPRMLTVGKITDLYAIAFECHEPGRFPLLTLKCVADDSYPGGEIRLRAGVDAQGSAFLGFATCGDGQPQKLPAGGGAIKLEVE